MKIANETENTRDFVFLIDSTRYFFDSTRDNFSCFDPPVIPLMSPQFTRDLRTIRSSPVNRERLIAGTRDFFSCFDPPVIHSVEPAVHP